MKVVPITLKASNDFVRLFHRNHKPVVGHKFSVAVEHDGVMCGVAIVGRPVSRHLDDGVTLEVTRVCTTGEKNACSMLYGAAWRAAKALGYRKIVTYTLPEEGGASLRAANWEFAGEAGGGNWNCDSRPRKDSEHQCVKHRWEKVA